MVQLRDISPLTGFLRDHKAYIQRLTETGRPEVLTVNGRAKVIVQDAGAYQQLLDLIDELDAQRILKQRLASVARDEPGIPANQVLADVKKQLGAAGKKSKRRK